MKKQGKIVIFALIVLFSAVAVFSFYLYPDTVTEKNSSMNSDNTTSNTDERSGSSSVNSNKTAISSSQVLGTNEYGKVIKEGPYGNKNSPVKVAYIVGVHPLESNSHKAAIESLKSQGGSLKRCYYIYRVVVTKDADNYDNGRMNGQLLAKSFIVPDIKSNGFQLAVDVHSNRGNYEQKRFVFAPIEGSKSESIARNVKNGIPGFVYHFPFSQTSPQYVTIPLINSGIPAIVFETDIYEPYSTTKSYTDKLILAVDNVVL
jgi:hypothetical protein